MPYFAGVTSGETDALVRSFAGEPELHHPVRGRVKGRRAFERFVTETNAWLVERNAVVSQVERIITPRRGVEETVLTLDGDRGRIELPMAVVADRDDERRIIELRVYYSTWPLTGRHANRPPLLQPDPELHEPDVVGEYQRALAAGDVEAAVAAFEPDAYVREPAGGPLRPPRPRRVGRPLRAVLLQRRRHPAASIAPSPTTAARAHWSTTSSDGAGTEMRPEAGLAVYVRGTTGKLAGARIYDDADPPVERP